MIKSAILFFFLTFSSFSQQKESEANIRKQIEDYNIALAKAFIKADKTSLLKLYTDNSILMPEHSRQRIGRKAIDAFFQQWLSQSKITAYQKTIFELQDLGGYILEIGNFKENLIQKNDKPYNYLGKYMVLWNVSAKNKILSIQAEIWGADSYFDDSNIPEINDSAVAQTKEYEVSNKLNNEVKERNEFIRKLVKERAGAEHAKMFMPDAIYMTYYTPMLVGIDNISKYFIEHEKPGSLSIDNILIKTSGIIEAKKAILEFGFYNVDWSDGNSKGNVKGKSINIWKRNSNGELLLFRQMVNHD